MKKWESFEPAFCVVRVSMESLPTATAETLTAIITTVRVVWSVDVAEAETRRLNQLNGGSGDVYFFQHTRVRKR